MSKLKVMTILGTRPEIIRLSRVMDRLDRYTDHVIVHTGQNWDYELNEVFFEDLGVRKPDHFLGVGGGSLGETLGGILTETEKVLVAEKPEAVVVLGDTNSAISAIMARRMKIPVYHMEAGNRSFDRNVPEETNRRIVDHIADFNLVYSEHARRHLLSEGLEHRRINLTGSPMREVLEHYRPQIEASDVVKRLSLTKRGYFVASLHREENVDNKKRLTQLVDTLNTLAKTYDIPVILSTHPRTRKRLEALELTFDSRVKDMKPFGFHDYNNLQTNAFCAISDSGTIAEEASILGFPAITPRDAIERPEAVDVGSLVMTGLNRDTILDGVHTIVAQYETRTAAGLNPVPTPDDYIIANTSERVVNLILGTARLSNNWDGIRMNQS
ncbi:non-hydrolyzing UDP-N-acetylglucosamine 2-epimerase [Sulfitobacter geojensis]|uniref:non-hydrolyzing UDP-N-acetylglucosamine 2-epimerase n=1 Tax=Sulfitobacter geojensis TaxID=1342299 RepID=UPI000469DE4F|nr:UDP-N-acetylglucosamine 2-epimerase (non-hydrolyzing) [Sulfitobacter geojensis]KHA50149.1 UDP-N-acetylglucosamine 2-epimerase [Sulfitobacter geojensis]NYI27455.1 UDP-N-acetylglucosamine 2-epimerase (non-hydrolyzing) [Sulfitobacter geojensis]